MKRSLLPGNSLISAEQDPEPITWCMFFFPNTCSNAGKSPSACANLLKTKQTEKRNQWIVACIYLVYLFIVPKTKHSKINPLSFYVVTYISICHFIKNNNLLISIIYNNNYSQLLYSLYIRYFRDLKLISVLIGKSPYHQ